MSAAHNRLGEGAVIEAVKNLSRFVNGEDAPSELRFDDDQRRQAVAMPDGPQRIRGLAGTGKTMVFAHRAAQIHVHNPSWCIAFVFFTKSLYTHVQNIIGHYVNRLSGGGEWNQNKLEVIHAWGTKSIPGFYQRVAAHTGSRFFTSDDAEKAAGTRSPNKKFLFCCDELETDLRARQFKGLNGMFDCILIDEGQDLPFSFYRIAYEALSAPRRRLYWAYDEAQSLGSFLPPNPSDIWGRDSAGRPIVDLRGRSPVLRNLYRTPQDLLMVANAINMGLFSKDGPVQGITNAEEWRKIGYEIAEGSFHRGSTIVLRRRPESAKHAVDQFPSIKAAAGELLCIREFSDEQSECGLIAKEVKRDLVERKIPADDILITPIMGLVCSPKSGPGAMRVSDAP